MQFLVGLGTSIYSREALNYRCHKMAKLKNTFFDDFQYNFACIMFHSFDFDVNEEKGKINLFYSFVISSF